MWPFLSYFHDQIQPKNVNLGQPTSLPLFYKKNLINKKTITNSFKNQHLGRFCPALKQILAKQTSIQCLNAPR